MLRDERSIHAVEGSLHYLLCAILGYVNNKGELKLDFQVNGKTYYLGLAEDSREWFVFESTETGARSIPVYVDATDSEDLPLVKGKKRREMVQ